MRLCEGAAQGRCVWVRERPRGRGVQSTPTPGLVRKPVAAVWAIQGLYMSYTWAI